MALVAHAFRRLFPLVAFAILLAGACEVDNDGTDNAVEPGVDGGVTDSGVRGVDGGVIAIDSGVTGVDGRADSGGTDAPAADVAVPGVTDALTDASTAPQDATPFDCTGKANGTSCGGGAICLANACVSSRCGDGYVHTTVGEECEDGNDVDDDGCFNCRFECRSNDDCGDDNACNGVETCDKSMPGKQLCKAGTAPAASSVCTVAGGGAGVCKNATCVTVACGNSVVDAGEECDDGNAIKADGCTNTCKFTCKANADCDDGNKCTGTETCNVTTHVCAAGTAVTCAMGVGGCAGTCAPTTGACSYVDLDKDGKTCLTDCSDTDPAIFPGAFECKDAKDNDCNAATLDATAPGCECYVDNDLDGYATTAVGAIPSPGICPAKYTRLKPTSASTIDCAGNVTAAHPDQASYFATAYCKPGSILCVVTTYDYDCDGLETPFDKSAAALSCATLNWRNGCIAGSGWVGAIPGCGEKGTYRQCKWNRTTDSCSGTDTADRRQECH